MPHAYGHGTATGKGADRAQATQPRGSARPQPGPRHRSDGQGGAQRLPPPGPLQPARWIALRARRTCTSLTVGSMCRGVGARRVRVVRHSSLLPRHPPLGAPRPPCPPSPKCPRSPLATRRSQLPHALPRTCVGMRHPCVGMRQQAGTFSRPTRWPARNPPQCVRTATGRKRHSTHTATRPAAAHAERRMRCRATPTARHRTCGAMR